MVIIKMVALFSCGTFFGAAFYISLAQHPAALAAGVTVGGRFFPPMYKRATPLQITLALAGFVSGLIAWYQSMDSLWLIGGLLLFSVIPITLIFIKPVNDVLLHPDSNPDSPATEELLRRWGPKHWWRTVVIGAAFILYMPELANSDMMDFITTFFAFTVMAHFFGTTLSRTVAIMASLVYSIFATLTILRLLDLTISKQRLIDQLHAEYSGGRAWR
jgi:hypothetical protein